MHKDKISESAQTIREMIDKAIVSGKITRSDYDKITHIATEDSNIDHQEKVLLAQLHSLIEDKSIKFDLKASVKKVIVYCGETVQDKCGPQLHPTVEVKNAERLVLSDKDEVAYSNNTDFVSAVKYIGLKHKVPTEFFLNGVSCGDDIEPVFEDFNKALDMINKLALT